MAGATAQRRTRQRETPVAEHSTVESASSPAQRAGQRKNAASEQPALESSSSSMRCTRQRKRAADEEPKAESSPASPALTGKKRPGASETANGFLEVASGIVACDGQSPSRKKVKALSPRGANKFEEEEEVKILDLKPEVKEEIKDNVICDEPMENSSGKKKGSSAKKSAKPEKDEESICKFIGNPVPQEEAQRRWPERYAKKAGDGEPNYIGRLIEFFKTVDEKLYFRAQWFYKAEDTVISYHASDHEKRRVFLSDDKNDNDLDCIVAKITIIRLSNNIDLHAKKEIPECDYYYDMSYSTSYSTFANLPKDDTSGVSCISTSSDEGSELETPSMNATLLDLYSGCGAMSTGLCHGAQLAGLNLHTAWAVDINPFACESLRLNHPKTKVRNEKAEDFLVLIKEWKKLCEKYSLDVKNPPKPNKDTSDLSDDDTHADSSPVPSGEFEVDHFVDICYGDPNEIGKKQLMFKVRWKGYGGANFRDFPGVRVGPNNVVEFDPEIERVLLPSGSPLVPDYAMSFIKGKSPKPFGRLWWDETVPTVVTRAEPHNQIILHPEQDRVLSVRENARLQGFPDYYKLCGPIKERYIQVGNAVAMPVSRVLGYSLAEHFKAKVATIRSSLFPQISPLWWRRCCRSY
ncbi:DNA (cytosine-5)-methyltransferase 1 [Platanthera guangdongensis]|uniref:DNA (cytosine-5-)-methyltransferase n=1 Tax=Platanthera guangdongensis TaxID=2320717 RepID=A0ABR2N0Y0_9ASPA